MDAKTEEDLFDEWRGLFNLYRNNDMLPKEDRERFIQLSEELRKLCYFQKLPSILKERY